MKKRLLALLLATIMLLSLVACTGGRGRGDVEKIESDTDPLTKDDVIKVVFYSDASWPYQDSWKVIDYIRENVGATVEFNPIPNSELGTKYSVMFADPETLPDTVPFDSKSKGDSRAAEGSAISFEAVSDYMPNYNKWVDSLSENDYANFIQTRKSADGKIYYSPLMGRDTTEGVMCWMYRKDIFDKHNLKAPETFDELYEVCKELKKLYPDSYPLCMRSGLAHNLTVQAPSWDKNWNGTGFYYNEAEGKWKYAPLDPAMKEYLVFMLKMVEEGLVNPDFATIKAAEWQQLISTNRGFMTPEYQTRIDFFNSIFKDNNEEGRFAAMVPPVANAEKGAALVMRNSIDPYGYILCNTRDHDRIANAAKYLDWFYADENVELVSWGKEGETFEVVDGKKQYITNGSNEPVKTLYGFGVPGTFMRIDKEAIEATESADIRENREMVLEHRQDKNNAASYIAFNEDERRIMTDTGSVITKFTNETLTKIVLGQLPLSAYDELEAKCYEYGLEEVLATYEAAYARIK
ncbi:MAG: extracellular solute-binding protein [Oscillospiraceae bacterium]|nr:extracellular solute-binding protein [Oscillospiraceae bacterium]